MSKMNEPPGNRLRVARLHHLPDRAAAAWCHRSFIVSINSITSIDVNVIVIEKQLIPIGSVYKESLMKRLKFL